MAASRRGSPALEPFRGAALVIGLSVLIGVGGAIIAGVLVWVMT